MHQSRRACCRRGLRSVSDGAVSDDLLPLRPARCATPLNCAGTCCMLASDAAHDAWRWTPNAVITLRSLTALHRRSPRRRIAAGSAQSGYCKCHSAHESADVAHLFERQ